MSSAFWTSDKLQKLVFCNAFAYKIAMNEYSEKILIDELSSIRIIEKSQEFTTVTVRPEIVSGAKILIKNGPFKGMTGIVERRKDSTNISINIEILGQSAPLRLTSRTSRLTSDFIFHRLFSLPSLCLS